MPKKTRNMGIIHQSLRSQRNQMNSPMMEAFDDSFGSAPIRSSPFIPPAVLSQEHWEVYRLLYQLVADSRWTAR